MLTLLLGISLNAQVNLKFQFKDPCNRKIDSLYFIAYEVANTSYNSNGDSLRIAPGFYKITYTARIEGKSMEWSNSLIVANVANFDTTVVVPRILKTSTFKTTKTNSLLYYYCNELANGLITDIYPNGKIRITGNFIKGRPVSKVKYFNINGQSL